jgi:hypothetical protein
MTTRDEPTTAPVPTPVPATVEGTSAVGGDPLMPTGGHELANELLVTLDLISINPAPPPSAGPGSTPTTPPPSAWTATRPAPCWPPPTRTPAQPGCVPRPRSGYCCTKGSASTSSPGPTWPT